MPCKKLSAVETMPPGLLLIERILLTPAAEVVEVRLGNRMLGASKRSNFRPTHSLPCAPIPELSFGREVFVTPNEFLRIAFAEPYTGEIEVVCHEPTTAAGSALPERAQSELRQRLVKIAKDNLGRLSVPPHHRVVVIVTDGDGEFVGVSSNTTSDDQSAIIWSAAHGSDPEHHG